MAWAGDAAFEFLFKYRPVVFERGELVLADAPGAVAAVLVAAAVGGAAIVGYARAPSRVSRRDRAVLAALRVAAVALVALCLLRPALELSEAVPQRNVLAVLLDDSRSMRIPDVDGASRADWVRAGFADPASEMLARLGEKFQLRVFRFAGAPEPLGDAAALAGDGSATRLALALREARAELAGVPLAGVVVVSDGADNAPPDETPAAPGTWPIADAAGGVPVFTVGVGEERFAKDIAVRRIEVPRTALAGATLVADVTISQRGYAGQVVDLVVEDEGVIASTQRVTLPDDGEAAPVRVRVPLGERGVRRLRVRVAPREGELIAENNARDALVRVDDRPERILYLEGEPRFEMKFIRRAVEGDSALQLVTLQRTAENKFLRLGVRDSLELVTGFPATREELFAFRGIVLGSVEANFFTLEQLRMLADFVSTRGGGLLLLGGRRAFAEGGYAGTPLADVIPVALAPARAGEGADAPVGTLRVEPTAAGAAHPSTQVASSLEESAARWKTLPAVTTVNRLGATKPGATTLLQGRGADGPDQPVLLWQRYGRGRVLAIPVQDTWMWQMHADVPLEDETHETFWRQLLRWLVSETPGQLAVTPSADDVEPGETVSLRAEVSDALYLKKNDARVAARVTAPSGAVTELPMDWRVDRDGEYGAAFAPAEAGRHVVEVSARIGDRVVTDTAAIDAGESRREWFDAEMRAPLLRRLADETGGRFYTPATVDALPEDVVFTESGTTVRTRKELWDMPVVFLLLIGLVVGEWGWRRVRGLA
ncbi:MAG TPA: glutamine amidotransferase [Gemmatimonadaceae bacterium]